MGFENLYKACKDEKIMRSKKYFGIFDFDGVLLGTDYKRVCKELGIPLDGFSEQKDIEKEPIKFLEYVAPFLKGREAEKVARKIAEHSEYMAGWELLIRFYENDCDFIIVTNNPLADSILKEKGYEELGQKLYKTTELKREGNIFTGEVERKGRKIDYIKRYLDEAERILLVTDNNTEEEKELPNLLEKLGYSVKVRVI